MTYSETLDYLYSHLPMFTRIGAAALKPNLDNTIALCRSLGNPERTFKSIHIAGTNGKGSTSHMLASVLQESGLKVGLYTSPHLVDFRERIRVNGQMVPRQSVIDFVEKHIPVFEAVKPSFFEWTVALCFDHFAREQVDIAVIETGLGGRLDSTNVIMPQLSVITNIGWDHMDILGDSLQKIAVEKAGIIKSRTPAILGEHSPATKAVFEAKASAEHAPISFTQEHFELRSFHSFNTGVRGDVYKNGTLLYEKLEAGLGGNYQQKNILTALDVIMHLQSLGYTITEKHIRAGLAQVKENTGLTGRWQVIRQAPLTVCDTGHNVDGLRYVIGQIAQNKFKKLHMVIGMVKDKDIGKVLALLPEKAVYYFCNANLPRALPAKELQERAATAGLKGEAYESVQAAAIAAQNNAAADDFIFIGGSTFVVADFLTPGSNPL